MKTVLICRPVSTFFALGGALLGLFPLIGCDGSRPVEPSLEAAAARSSGLKAPSSTSATLVDSNTVQITWTDNSPNEDGFRIERSATTTGPWVTAGTTSAQATSFTDGGRTSETQVCYRVIAFKRSGDSDPSNTDCTTPPAAPTALTASAVDPQTIALGWTDNSAVEDGYEVQRATAYAGPFSSIGTLAANAVSYRDGGLTTNATYWYRVRAKKDAGFSAFSNVATASVSDVPPNAPFMSYVTTTSSTSVSVTWVDNSDNEDGFRVESSTSPDGPWSQVGAAPPVNWWYVKMEFTGLPSEQQVCYRVIAFNRVGDSPPTSTRCTITLATPTDLIATGFDAQTIDLTWKDNSVVEDGYEVWLVDEAFGFLSNAIAYLPAGSTSYRYTDVDAYLYGYAVVASKGGFYSAFSNYTYPPTPGSSSAAARSVQTTARPRVRRP